MRAQSSIANPLPEGVVRQRAPHLPKSLPLWLPATALGVAALLLRVVRLDFQPLWFDEGYSFYFATSGISRIAPLTAQDIHPPAYYYLLDGWLKALGRSDVSGRLLSVLLGVAAVVLLFMLGRRLLGDGAGLVAAFLLAISPLHVYYSQEVRMYALVTALGVASTLLFCAVFGISGHGPPERVGGPGGRIALIAGYVLVTAAAMYTQYYAAFLPLAQALFLAISRRPARTLWRIGLPAGAGLILAFAPWVWYAGPRLQAYVQSKVAFEGYAALSPLDFLGQALLAFGAGDRTAGYAIAVAAPYLLLALGGLVALGLAARHPLRRRPPGGEAAPAAQGGQAALLSLLLILVPLLAGWLVNVRFPFHPPMWERLFLFSLPYFLLLVAGALATLRNRSRPAFAVGMGICIAAAVPALWSFHSVPRYADEDYRPVVALASALGRPDDLVIAIYPWQIGYYQALYRGALPELVLAPSQVWADDPAEMARALDGLSAGHEREWLLSYEALGRRLEMQLDAHLATRAYPALSRWFGNSRLLLFSSTPPEPASAPPVNFEGKLEATLVEQSPGPLEAGKGILNVSLDWRLLQRPEGQYTVNLRLADDHDRTWAQRDAEPNAGLRTFDGLNAGDRLKDRHGVLIPAGTPPGTYTLKLGVEREGQRLSALDENGAPKGPEVALGRVVVERPPSPPPVSSLFLQRPVNRELAPGLRLLGYSGPSGAFAPGQLVPLTLFWQAEGDRREDHPVHLALIDGGGKVLARSDGAPVDGRYPTAGWLKGELVREQREIRIPAETPTGELELVVSAGAGKTAARTAKIQVVGRDHLTTRPEIGHPLSLTIGGFAELAGFDVAGASGPAGQATVRPGGSVGVTLYWRVRSTTERDLTVFVHLLDRQGRMWGQSDSRPGGGTLPTTGWVSGEYLVDNYVISVKPEAPEGPLSLEVGMYDRLTGERCLIRDGTGRETGDSAIVGGVEVRK